jgi:hypothetical protein
MRNMRSVLLSRSVLILLSVFHVLSPAMAQQAKPAEPELVGAVYLLDSSDQILKPLPKAPAKVVAKPGFGSAKGDIQIPEPESSFRIKTGDDLKFVVKCTNPESFELFEFKKKGKNREAQVSTAKSRPFQSPTVQKSGGIEFAVTKYGESSYLFVVKAPEPGEYGFATGWSVFHFAIDPKNTTARRVIKARRARCGVTCPINAVTREVRTRAKMSCNPTHRD